MKYKLKEIFDLQMGKTPARNNEEYWNSKDYKWISIADLTISNKYINNTKEHISKLAVLESGIKLIPANTVVMSFKLSIGKTAILCEDMYSNEAIMAFHDKHIVELLTEYIYYLIKAKDWNDGSNRAVMGQTLNKATLSEIEVDIHTIEEQRRIVKLMSYLEKVIHNRKEQLQKLEDIIRARFVEMFGDLVVNPYKWTVVKLSEISLFLKSGLSRRLSDVDIGLPVIRSGNIQNGQFVYNDIKYWYKDDPQGANTEDYRLENGDILVNFINSASQIGKTAIFSEVNRECIYTTNILRMKLTDSCNVYYYNWFAMSDYYYRQLQNIIQPAVNQASFTTVNFLKLNIPLPPLQLQKQFETFVHQVDKSKVEVQKALDEAQLLFDSLMQKYFG